MGGSDYFNIEKGGESAFRSVEGFLLLLLTGQLEGTVGEKNPKKRTSSSRDKNKKEKRENSGSREEENQLPMGKAEGRKKHTERRTKCTRGRDLLSRKSTKQGIA